MYLQAKASQKYAVLYSEKMKKYKEELNRQQQAIMQEGTGEVV